jgi:hypothetical protein
VKKIIGGIIAVSLAAPMAIKSVAALPPPYRDGCSGGMSFFYRNVLGQVPAWEGCCDAHDKLYGPGGTSDMRAAADRGLYECVAASGHTIAAGFMWAAVKVGGQPFFPFGWRWGFEKDYSASWWYGRSGAE